MRRGRLSLRPGEVALDASLAQSTQVGVGDRLRLYLPDGTRATPLVVATYARGMGLSQVTLGRAALAGQLAPLGTVLDRADTPPPGRWTGS